MMIETLSHSAYFGAVLSLAFYELGVLLRKKWKSPLCNPLLISIVLTVAVLAVLKIPYEVYYSGAKYISWLLTPATVCLAVPLYEQLAYLKKYPLAILAGIVSGILSTMLIILASAFLFRLSHAEYVTFLPKSVTTAIGMGVSERLGGYPAISAAVIIISGIIGNISAEPLLRLLRVTEPVAKGVAIGSASHAIGTAKALEMGELEGAMSGLSIAVSGVLTVFAAMLFAGLY